MKKDEIFKSLVIAGVICLAPIVLPKDIGGYFMMREAHATVTKVTQSGLTFEIDNSSNVAAVTSTTLSGDVDIPSSINNVPVTMIANYAFSSHKDISSVKIPNSIRTIGENAFQFCEGLKSISIPESIREVDSYAFYNCTNLTDVIVLSSTIKVDSYAFQGCKIISGSAPLSLKGVAWLPENETFNYLGDVNIDGIAYNYTDSTKTELEVKLSMNLGIAGKIEIPEMIGEVPVVGIGSESFQNCNKLTSIILPDSIRYIENSAFRGCVGLTSINIPKLVKSLDYNTFSGCVELESIEIPESITSLGDNLFSGCRKLSTVNLPNSLISVGMNTFKNTLLTELTLPESVEALTGSWDLPLGINMIRASNTLIASCTSPTGYFKVYLYNTDGSQVLASYLVKSGTNFLLEANKYGTTWHKESGGMIGNISADSEYSCDIVAGNKSKLDKPTITSSKTNANNRETDISIKIN